MTTEMSSPEPNPLDVEIPFSKRSSSTALDKFCRLCLEVHPDLLPLKSRLGELGVPKMFAFLTGIEIDFDDEYPKVACSTCFTRLEQAYHARKDFLDNYHTLLSIVIAGPEAVAAPPPPPPLVTVPEGNVAREEIVIEDDCNLKLYKKEYFSDSNDVEMVEKEEDFIESLDTPEPECEEIVEECLVEEMITADASENPFREDVSENSAKPPPRKRTRPNGKKSYAKPQSIYEEKKRLRKIWKMDPNKCYICKEVFESPRDLNLHLPQHSDLLPYRCEECLNGNGPQKNLIVALKPLHTHFRQHSGCTPCPQCPFKVFGKEALYHHTQMYHAFAGQKFICETCGFVLPNKRAHYMHMLRHRHIEKGTFRCETCDLKFGSNSRLQRHLLLHKEKEFQCQFCPKTFINNTLLLTHERTHTGGTLSICATCGEKFSNSTKRWQHTSEMHPEVIKSVREAGHYTKHQPKSLICEYPDCGYKAPHYPAFWYHVQTHELRYACEQCPKRFPTSQALKYHGIVHTGEREFACEECGKRYSQKVALTKHWKSVHSTATPYVCQECGEKFSHRTRLNNHMLKHSAPQHHCEYCNKSFRYKGDMTRHMKLHEDGGDQESSQE